jgi:hypothetical protein
MRSVVLAVAILATTASLRDGWTEESHPRGFGGKFAVSGRQWGNLTSYNYGASKDFEEGLDQAWMFTPDAIKRGLGRTTVSAYGPGYRPGQYVYPLVNGVRNTNSAVGAPFGRRGFYEAGYNRFLKETGINLRYGLDTYTAANKSGSTIGLIEQYWDEEQVGEPRSPMSQANSMVQVDRLQHRFDVATLRCVDARYNISRSEAFLKAFAADVNKETAQKIEQDNNAYEASDPATAFAELGTALLSHPDVPPPSPSDPSVDHDYLKADAKKWADLQADFQHMLALTNAIFKKSGVFARNLEESGYAKAAPPALHLSVAPPAAASLPTIGVPSGGAARTNQPRRLRDQ